MWQGPLKAWSCADSIVVAGLTAMEAILLKRADEGAVSCFAAERLLGTLRQRARGYGKDWWARQGRPHIWARRSRELRDLGLVLDEDGLGRDHAEEQLPLGLILRAAREAWPRTSEP